MSGAARAAPLLASFMMFFYLLYDVSAWLRQAPVMTGRTGRRSQIGGMHTAEGLFVSQKRATLTVKVSHESRVMRRCVASEAALCESEMDAIAGAQRAFPRFRSFWRP